MEVARRPEGPEVNGDLRKTVSCCSLVPLRELEGKGYKFPNVESKKCTDIVIFFIYDSILHYNEKH